MSDLYHETTEPDTSLDPAREAQAYTESRAETEDRIADQDELPTPADSRQATWGDNPDYYDETNLDAEYDGDIDAFLAEQDELPTPQESRAKTWGDDPDYYGETNLDTEYDGDLDAVTAEDQGQATAAEASPTALGTDVSPAETSDTGISALGDPPEPSTAEASEPVSDQNNRDLAEPAGSGWPESEDPVATTTSAEASDSPTPTTSVHAEDGHTTDDKGEAPDSSAMADEPDNVTDADMSAIEQDAPGSRADTEQVPSPEAERIRALETTDTDAQREIADLKASKAELTERADRQQAENARLSKSVEDLTTRLERLEQNMRGDDVPKVTQGRELDRDQVAEKEAKRAPDRHLWRSNEAIAWATVGAGVAVTTGADFLGSAPATYAGIGANVLAFAAASVGFYRKSREVRDAAHRPDD